MYGSIIPKPIWALEHGLTVWPKALTSTRPRISIQTRKGNEPILSEAQGLDSRCQFTFGLSVLSLSSRSSPSKIAVVQSLRHLCARQCLRECRRRACLLKWESFPKLLSPKTHLINDIGPLNALVTNVIIITPLLIAYKWEKNSRKRGGGEARGEREKSDLIESLC